MSDLNRPFDKAAQQVRRRLSLAHFSELLNQSAIPTCIGAALLVLWWWFYGFHWLTLTTAILGVLLWLIGAAAWAYYRQPSSTRALAFWDQKCDRKEVFTSAHDFERKTEPTAGEQLHIHRATQLLNDALPNMREQLPVSFWHRDWICPIALFGLVAFLLITPRIAPPPPPRAVLSEEQRRAAKLAEQLAERPQLTKVEEMVPEEREKLRKLDDAVDNTLDKLKDLDGETQRDVLTELERRAHEAEQMASSLAETDKLSLSSEMLAELARHVDTSEFAEAARAEKPDEISEEAKKLAKRLRNKDLTNDERERVEQALAKAMGVASDADKAGAIGQHLDRALQQLKKRQPQKASDEFSKLAKKMQRALQRKQTQQQLQQLAQQLRAAGQKIFGKQNQVRKLAKQKGGGLRKLNAGQQAALKPLPLQQRGGQPMALAGGNQPAGKNNPGQAIAAVGKPQAPNGKPNAMVPIPGANSNGPNAGQMPLPGGQAPIPGAGQVPGTGQTPGAGQMPGAGQTAGGAPVPGAGAGAGMGTGQSGAGAGDGGHQAGHGSAPYGNSATNPLAATKSITAQAHIGDEGESRVRKIEGQPHREQVTREAANVALTFLRREEEALADEPLPISRRDQVRRYFSALRRHIGESTTGTD